MKTTVKLLSLVLAFLFLMTGYNPTIASEARKPFADKAQLYKQFEDPALLKEFYFQARDVAAWLSRECAASEGKCQDALELLRRPFSRWNNLDAKTGFHAIVNCEAGSSVTHPNPALHYLRDKPVLHLRDINGKLWLLHLCDEGLSHPDGFWNTQYSSWCRSITGINEIWIRNAIVHVTGTDYHVLSHIPYNSKSPRDIEAKARELNGLVLQWSEEWASSKQ